MADPSGADETSRTVVQRLKGLYTERLRPIEVSSHFAHFHVAPLTASELEARPQVLLVGQYSTGKTSLIKWVTGIDSSFFDIRPQPSTDKFMAIVHGDEEKVINGDAATCLPELPYSGLSRFGSSFLSKFQVLVERAEILKQLTFVDTPGVLSGDKQRISRGYDFMKVCQWLASRCDLILLLFDAHKLDISDEFKEVIEAMKSDGDKCRCVLNKADEIDGENLVKVYGALMWNLGKILCTPEVARMFIGSFWNQDYKCKDLERLLDQDRKDLLQELQDLPRSVCVRRVNEVVQRARAVKVQLALGAALRSRLPFIGMCGRRRRRERWLCDRIPEIYQEVIKDHQFAAGDMPPVDRFRERLLLFKDFRRFPRWNDRQMADLDRLIEVDVPRLMALIGGVSASGLRDKRAKETGEGAVPLSFEPDCAPRRRWPCMALFVGFFLAAAAVAGAMYTGAADPYVEQFKVQIAPQVEQFAAHWGLQALGGGSAAAAARGGTASASSAPPGGKLSGGAGGAAASAAAMPSNQSPSGEAAAASVEQCASGGAAAAPLEQDPPGGSAVAPPLVETAGGSTGATPLEKDLARGGTAAASAEGDDGPPGAGSAAAAPPDGDTGSAES